MTPSKPYWQSATGKIMFQKWKEYARSLKTEIYALTIAYRDPRTPWYAKTWALAVAAYALSPIDLIPDFIPVLGYLDDLIIVPAAILLCVRLIPPPLMAELRAEAARRLDQRLPGSKAGAAIIVGLWLAMTAALAWLWLS